MKGRRNFYWITKNGLNPSQCRRILDHGEGKWEVAGEMIGTSTTKIISNKRRCKVAWLTDQWIYDMVFPIMKDANENAGWKYEISEAEDTQITLYEVDNFYSLHSDGDHDHFAVDNSEGTVRKLSMTVQLNDSYSGGELRFCHYENKKCQMYSENTLGIGDCLTFPSDIEHEITPVLYGTRYALVVWFRGKPYK